MSILQNLQENVVETAEQMIKVVEEGVAILTGTQMSENTFEDTPTSDYDQSGDDDFTMGEEEDLANMRSPLDGITEGVLGDLMKNQAVPTTMRENFDAFRSAITWKEPFILTIVVFQIVMLLCTFMVTRRCGVTFRILILSIMAGIVRSAEWLNKYGSRNWEQFATQNYFDEKGIFVSIMVSAPLLMMAFLMLISFLREASGLLVEVKKHELRQKQKSSKANASSEDKKRKKRSKKDD